MSSPLDGRIRAIAREEAEKALNAAPAAVLETSGPDPLAGLEEQVAELSARIDELEKTAAVTVEATPPMPRRTSRKASGAEKSETLPE